MNALTLTQFRDKLSEVLDDVETTDEAWTITRNGRPVAMVISVDEYESLVESLNILSDPDTMGALAEADADVAEGRVTEVE